MKRMSLYAPLAAVVSGLLQIAAGQAVDGSAAVCRPTAFLTFEQGKLAAVDWVEPAAGRVHTKVVETQSHVIDATIEVQPDGTASHASVTLSVAGEEAPAPTGRDLGEGAIYWSPRVPSSIEQAIRRARVLNAASVTLPGASLFSSARADIGVDRVDPTDWAVLYQGREYLVQTDVAGCMVAATLPDFGVTIERRDGFAPAEYPLWTPYGAPPDGAYTATAVAIRSAQGHTLAGTLTRPRSEGVAPAAVLITGLSPHERNNGDAPWMPFRDLADALTRAGVAVLRVDDRGVGKSTGDHAKMTIFDKADDVRTQVEWLRRQPGIDPKRIELVGYSEGGLLAPMIAAGDPAIAAVVTLDGPGVSGREVARYQVAQPILRDPSMHMTEAERAKAIDQQYQEALKDLTPHEQTFLDADPMQYDRNVRCPALVIQGATDAHVPLRSAERIAGAMRSGGNQHVTVRIFPGVSHSLLPDPSGLSSGWAGLPGFLTEPALLDDVATWSARTLR